MKKAIFLAAFVVLLSNLAFAASDEAWINIPVGAKASYMGIHGGTMPVSLLVSDDGSSLFTFVGQTGNDFIEALKKVHLNLPSFANATHARFNLPVNTALFAGNSTASMPVFMLSGDILAKLDPETLQPFGLSSQPVSIEGEAVKPLNFPHARSFRLFSLPNYFHPRR